MRRHNNLYQRIISIDNLKSADMNARIGKSRQPCIRRHDRNREKNIINLHHKLLNHEYRTSPYTTFTITDPKERVIYRLPYYPDRIVHHAVMNIMRPIFMSAFTSDTYSCIKGRGIHKAVVNMKKALLDREGTTYCLKIDIKKFYPSIDHSILKELLRKKVKDKELLTLVDEIIDSCSDGLPIGNYLSQYLANFYLCYFDHWVKEVMKVKYYFRYADDMVFLSDNKGFLHRLLYEIKKYLGVKLKLTLKKNWQVYPVEARGIDFLGYVFRHDYVRVRDDIKAKFARMLKRNPNRESIASYMGWFKHADCKHLTQKLLNGNNYNTNRKAA